MTPKFRRWDKINKVMLQHKDIPVLLKNARDDNQFVYILWTGLLDKAGVEIYDGDFVRKSDPVIKEYDGAIGIVRFDGSISGLSGFGVDRISGAEGSFYYPDGSNFGPECIEVIGNVHDNPELLHGRK